SSSMAPAAQGASHALFIRLTTTGASQILALLTPDAAIPDERETRVRAASVLQETVGRQPTTYLSLLAEVDLQTGWKKLALRLPRDDGYSIDLLIARKERCLLVISARRTSAGKYVHEVEITPRLHVGVDSA